jgi:RND family efflux transporter MFP subunit
MKMNRRAILSICLGASAAILPGCDTGGTPEESEHPSVVVTQWNDSTELFLEYPHLLAGEPTGNWAIHLSNMKNFKPLTEGVLTVRFFRGATEMQAFTLDAPARDGIYLLDPVIEEPGEYRVQLALSSTQVSSVHELPEVYVWAAASELPPAEEEPAGGISFLKEQAWKIPFAIEPAREEEVARSISAPGEIVAPDGALAEVSAPISGIAAATSNRGAPSVGQAVSAGQVLAILSPTSGEGGYAQARGNLERLQREAERAERLYAVGAIPRKRLEETIHDLEIARAEVAAMGGGADGDFRLRVRAPFAGVIAERGFVPGGRVEAGEPLFTVVDPRRVWLRVQMPGDAASGLTQGARAVFTSEGSPRTFVTTRLVSVGTMLDTETRTVPAVFEVDNSGGLIRIGQFVRASVPVGGTVRGVTIPVGAILDDNGTPVAYVQTGGETFERRVLTVGVSDGTLAHIAEGIEAGEMVVTTGAYQVRLASLSPEGFSGGHAH